MNINSSLSKGILGTEFKMYSTTKHGLVQLSNIDVSVRQHSKYHWRIYSKPTLSEDNLSNCAGTSTRHSSVNTTIKTAAYFALCGFMGFSIVWLFLIMCLIYENYCPV